MASFVKFHARLFVSLEIHRNSCGTIILVFNNLIPKEKSIKFDIIKVQIEIFRQICMTYKGVDQSLKIDSPALVCIVVMGNLLKTTNLRIVSSPSVTRNHLLSIA